MYSAPQTARLCLDNVGWCAPAFDLWCEWWIHIIRAVNQTQRTFPQPINRQCLSIRLDSAIFSPFSAHAGVVKAMVTSPPFRFTMRPPVCETPMLTKRVSPTASLATFAFFVSSVLTPSSLRSRNTGELVCVCAGRGKAKKRARGEERSDTRKHHIPSARISV
jgi:hypothetical protein